MMILGFIWSQILIINTKGLTRDISDTLEVSSYHLDALSNRDSNKPRISFVLYDMKDAKEAQHSVFLDIHKNLKKIECICLFFDNFYPQIIIVSAENFHYPAETFPLKISKLHEEILDSALIPSENYESQIFKNAIWKEIDARGNFLYFKDSKAIQQWKAMMNLVYKYYENNIKPYEKSVLNWIEEQTSEGQWNEDNNTAFETYLTQESEKRTFTDKKQKLKTTYALRQRHSKESYLIRSARIRIGKTVRKIHKDHKDKSPYEFKKFFSESKHEELFNEE
ncbi:23140_t:CDS:2 [Gigaspora margarita]|uniref:23140_t:CDS:1 n=1 Tax=Gigaspora margarita TaxID=4874 RepID=A0ABN7V524_GIGMA|nr:23140_t:CDS:2 [Gigaspora margarita]